VQGQWPTSRRTCRGRADVTPAADERDRVFAPPRTSIADSYPWLRLGLKVIGLELRLRVAVRDSG